MPHTIPMRSVAKQIDTTAPGSKPKGGGDGGGGRLVVLPRSKLPRVELLLVRLNIKAGYQSPASGAREPASSAREPSDALLPQAGSKRAQRRFSSPGRYSVQPSLSPGVFCRQWDGRPSVHGGPSSRFNQLGLGTTGTTGTGQSRMGARTTIQKKASTISSPVATVGCGPAVAARRLHHSPHSPGPRACGLPLREVSMMKCGSKLEHVSRK